MVLCLLLVLSLYGVERYRWITKESAYKTAKNYFVVGIVLRDIRSGIRPFSKPHRIIWKPFDWLQELISYSGRKLIPEDDGEHGIWEYHLFLQTYVDQIYAPKTAYAVTLNRKSFFILQSLATKRIADKKFRERDKYLIYPFTALMYEHTNLRKYNLKYGYDRFYKFYKDPGQYEETQQVVNWSMQLEHQWERYPAVTSIIADNPDTEVIQIMSTVLLLHQIIYYQIHNLEFTCEDKYLLAYWEYVLRFVSDDSPYHYASERLRKTARKLVLYLGDRINFFGHRLCNLKRLPAYSIKHVDQLGGEGPDWYDLFQELNRRLVAEEDQEENLRKIDPDTEIWDRFWNSKQRGR